MNFRWISNRLKGMRIELKSPEMDKGWGMEIFGAEKDFGLRFLALPEVKRARGFLQCNGENYCFVEFWTDNSEDILQAGIAIEKLANSGGIK